jgi:hypothetical protein
MISLCPLCPLWLMFFYRKGKCEFLLPAEPGS